MSLKNCSNVCLLDLDVTNNIYSTDINTLKLLSTLAISCLQKMTLISYVWVKFLTDPFVFHSTYPNHTVDSLGVEEVDLHRVTGDLTWVAKQAFSEHKPVLSGTNCLR